MADRDPGGQNIEAKLERHHQRHAGRAGALSGR